MIIWFIGICRHFYSTSKRVIGPNHPQDTYRWRFGRTLLVGLVLEWSPVPWVIFFLQQQILDPTRIFRFGQFFSCQLCFSSLIGAVFASDWGNQYNSNRCPTTSCNIKLLCGNLSVFRTVTGTTKAFWVEGHHVAYIRSIQNLLHPNESFYTVSSRTQH